MINIIGTMLEVVAVITFGVVFGTFTLMLIYGAMRVLKDMFTNW